MRDNYDFSQGEKNPYAGKLKSRYAVTVHYDFSNTESDKKKTGKKTVTAAEYERDSQ